MYKLKKKSTTQTRKKREKKTKANLDHFTWFETREQKTGD